jgi:gliding motility-associated-like protein
VLNFSMMGHHAAFAQFAFNIPDHSNSRTYVFDPITVAVSGKLALCSATDKGSIVLTVTGGIPPYKFQWNTNETTGSRSNLFAGTYTVKITDSQGTEHTERIIIQPPYPLILNPVEKKDASCGNDGSAKISIKTAHSSRAPYRITWSNGLKDVWEATNLAPGTYTVIVADKFNCDVTMSFEVKAGASAINVASTVENPTCTSTNSGKIQLNVSGGQAPFTYKWSNGSQSKDLTGVSAGTYQVEVRDSKGCVVQVSHTLTLPDAVQLDAKVTQPTCLGSSTGEIEVLTKAGKAPFSYLWNNGQTTSKLSNLTAGVYSVRVTDASGCIAEQQFNLQPTSNLSLKLLENRPVSCSGQADGGISIELTGAKGAYQITWSDGVKDLLQRKDLKAGTYTITASDESGCTLSQTVNVQETSKIQARIESALDVDCTHGSITGVAWVSISGGKEPYSISWNSTSGNSREINFNTSGILKVMVTDALNCTVETEARVDFPNQSTSGSRLDFQYRKLTISFEPEVLIEDEILFESEISSDFIAWEWEFGDGNKSTDKDPVHVFEKAGTFEVKLTGYDLYGCSTVEKNTIQVNTPVDLVVIPNAFSPNGDGLNDTFIPKLRAISSFQLEVFNTWGEKLFHTSSLETKGWDGTYRGQLVPAGNYLYSITYTTMDGQTAQRTGGITLIR